MADGVAVMCKAKKHEFQLYFYPEHMDVWMVESFAEVEKPGKGMDFPAGEK